VQDVPLGPLLERVASEFAGPALSRNLVLRVARTSAVARSDAALLERIVGNLVANAVRYTRRGGVVVGVLHRGRELCIAVVDTGIGIAPSEAARIFEEFYQVPDARVPAGRKGMGLGLAIVRRFADLLEHRVELRSQPGAGSRFIVRVPRAPALRRSRPSVSAPSLAQRPSVTLAGMLVAVLDDDPTVLDAMRALFSTWRADVAAATSVERLLDEIGRAGRYPDLIVADLRIATGADGVDAIVQLRDELGRDVPALVVTGDMSDAAATRVREAGLPLLYKPVDPGTLGEAAVRLMGTAETTLVV
jgi:CheY-like chemotaxis protein/anti-sigma regulatory factor (Ser/Thr protein kinase)